MVPIFLLMFQLGLIDTAAGVVAGAHRRPAAGGDLHPQGLHRRDAAQSYEESRARLRRQPAADRCATSSCRSRDPAWRRSRCGRWSTCGATSSSPSSCCATRRRHPPAVLMYTFYTEGGQREPRSHLDVLAACTRSRSSRCTCSSTAATASASTEGSRADGQHRPRRALPRCTRAASPPSTTSTLTIADGEFFALLGPVRLRQDHAAADHRRAGGRRPRASSASAAGT